ncbi:hypothetical protein ITG09_02460 [Vibrio cyclitrophicus]|nr:hypothetical protein [Vibrio cyclitrophicus]UPR52532.1 hypothetical protein ITG09_02460 [Vibrio cyclitrophicus]
MSDVSNVLISAAISFTISGIGWYLLDKRANRSSKRSETFSLITPTISLLNDLSEMAENSFNERKGWDQEKQQLFEVKFHAKFSLLRTKLEQLQSRKVPISNARLIDLRKAYTLGAINSITSFNNALNASQAIEVDLYSAFEREHNSR